MHRRTWWRWAASVAAVVGGVTAGGFEGKPVNGEFNLLPSVSKKIAIKWKPITLIGISQIRKLINASQIHFGSKIEEHGSYIVHQGDSYPAYIKSRTGYYFPGADKIETVDSNRGLFFAPYYTHAGVASSLIDMKNLKIYNGDILLARYRKGSVVFASNVAGSKYQSVGASMNIFPYPEFTILNLESNTSINIVFEEYPPLEQIPELCYHKLSISNGLVPYRPSKSNKIIRLSDVSSDFFATTKPCGLNFYFDVQNMRGKYTW